MSNQASSSSSSSSALTRERNDSSSPFPLIKIPGLKVPLMDEQRRHVYRIIEKTEETQQHEFVLCTICGGGKTLTALAVAKRDIQHDRSKKVLIVAPPSAINSWTSDASIHFDPVFRHVVLASTSEKNRCFFSSVNDCQLIILSYDALCSAHKSAVQWRTTILKSEIQRLEGLFPRGADTARMTTKEKEEYENGRERLIQVHTFWLRHKNDENMSVDIPFPDLYEKERDKTMRPMLFDNLYMTKFRWLFADEAHEARNNKSVKFASLRDIRREYSMAISATICNNSAEDYVSILKIIGVRPEQGWLSLRRNKEACASFMNACSQQMIVSSPKDVREKIKESYATKTILLRPHRFRHQEEIDAYENVRNEWRSTDGKRSKDTVLRVITALRQCCDFAETTDPNKGVVVTLKDGQQRRVVSSKLEMVVDYINNYVIPTGEKVLIFCWFKDTIQVLKAMLPPLLKVDVITGSVSQEKRRKLLDGFRRWNRSAVMVATPGTTSLGVNIPCANHCILVNNWWNPVVSEQAFCRNRRPGQKRSLRWVQVMIPNTVEDSIKLVADFKVELNDHMIAGGITSRMLDSITSNKAIQHAASTGSRKRKARSVNKNVDGYGMPSNLLLPIINQDTDAIIKMRSFCQQESSTNEKRRILPESFAVTFGGDFPTTPEPRSSFSSSGENTCFLNPQIERAEQLILSGYDYVVRTTEDLRTLSPTHPIDLSHVPQAREISIKNQPLISQFAQKRQEEDRKNTAKRKRFLEKLPEDQQGFRRFLSLKEIKNSRNELQGKEKRTIKLLSIDEIQHIDVPPDAKKQRRTPSSSSITVAAISGNSITTSLQRLQNISPVFLSTTSYNGINTTS